MSKQYTPRDAWLAFRDRQYELACHIWITLMSQALSLDAQRSYQLNYTHVLIAQKRYEEAEALLKELLESDPQPIYYHQLALVAREAGDLALARQYLHQEQHLIEAGRSLLLAGNEYELGIICWLEGELEKAIAHGRNALKHAQLADDLSAEGCVHRLIADLMKAMGDHEGADENYRAAQQAFTLIGDSLAAKHINRHLNPDPDKNTTGAEQP